jgi:hypothetical protein
MRPEQISALNTMNAVDRAQAIQGLRIALLIESAFSGAARQLQRVLQALSKQVPSATA